MSILERLLRFKPITPLTGEDDEWIKVSDEMGQRCFQNKRCSSVFKTTDAQGNTIEVHDIDAIAYSDNGGLTWFTSSNFRENVTFPYEPPTHPEKSISNTRKMFRLAGLATSMRLSLTTRNVSKR